MSSVLASLSVTLYQLSEMNIGLDLNPVDSLFFDEFGF